MIDNIDTIIYISNFLDILDHKHFILSTKEYLLLLFDLYRDKYNKKKTFILKHYIEIIITLMGGLKKMMTYPILPWKSHFLGSTDYIDKIKASDVYEPVMLGIDVFDRPFVTLRTRQIIRKKEHIAVNTLFQRYTDDKSWTHGTCYGSLLFLSESGYFYNSNNQYKFSHNLVNINIYQLLNDKKYIFGYHSINYKNQELITYEVSLC